MILAIFAILLLLNRQTGGVFEGFFIYLLPIPMVVYSAKFDWKSGLMVFVGMCAFSLFFGTLTTIFYAVSSALLGLIFGACLYKNVDMTLTTFIVMGMGERRKLEYSYEPADADNADTITWQSTDEAVAKVDHQGHIYATGCGSCRGRSRSGRNR